MEHVKEGNVGEEKKIRISDTIYFKQSVTEIIDAQRAQAIKSILNTVDLVVEPNVVNSESRKRIRKVVLDNINDLNRIFNNIIESLVKNKKKSGNIS